MRSIVIAFCGPRSVAGSLALVVLVYEWTLPAGTAAGPPDLRVATRDGVPIVLETEDASRPVSSPPTRDTRPVARAVQESVHLVLQGEDRRWHGGGWAIGGRPRTAAPHHVRDHQERQHPPMAPGDRHASLP